MALEVFTATNTGIKKLAQRNDESRQYQSRHKPLAVIALFVGQYRSGGTGLVQHLIIGHIGGFGYLHLRALLQKEGVDGVVEFVTAFQCQKISFQFGQVADATGQSSKLPAQLRSEEHTSELQSRPHLVCRLLLEKKNNKKNKNRHRLNHQCPPIHAHYRIIPTV